MVHGASHPDAFEHSPDARSRHHAVLAWIAALLALAFALVPVNAAAAGVAMQTVCTITVNSADEKEALRRHLPADRFRFVELVEKGRPDWLASARKQDLRCDVLVISGHFDGGIDGGNEFFPSRSRRASSCRSPRWSVRRAAQTTTASSRTSRKSICSAATRSIRNRFETVSARSNAA
jgi:hypothetical protein